MILITRKPLLCLAAASLLTLGIAVGLWQLSKARTYQVFGEIVSRVETDKPVVALTFDDGPTASYTQEVLRILAEHEVRATFFVIGREVEENLDEARAIVEAGHELANHSWSHLRMSLIGLGRVATEIERTDEAIRAAGQEGEIFFRPPYGKKLLTLPWYLSRNGRTTIMWDIEPETDLKSVLSSERITEHILNKVRPGSIILLHVMYGSREVSRQALPGIIGGLKQQGYSLITISELLEERSAAI